ncbi:MAG: hypothetical protein KJP21_04620, partial [Bacteroidia bacterium]|nr:hypothetical protein [Bacteroidia bacterium]
TQENLKKYAPTISFRVADGNTFIEESEFKWKDLLPKGTGAKENIAGMAKATGSMFSAMYDKVGDVAIGMSDRNVISATFVAEYNRITGRDFSEETDKTIDIEAVQIAQENAEMESSISSAYMKGKLLKDTTGNRDIGGVTTNLLKRAMFIFSSHVSSIYSTARASVTELKQREDLQGKLTDFKDPEVRAAWANVAGPTVQSLVFNLSKPKYLIPLIVLAKSMVTGEDEEERLETVESVYEFIRGSETETDESSRILRTLRAFVDPGGKPMEAWRAATEIAGAATVDVLASTAVGSGGSAQSFISGLASSSQAQKAIKDSAHQAGVAAGIFEPKNEFGSFGVDGIEVLLGAPAIVSTDILDSTIRPYTTGTKDAGFGWMDTLNVLQQIIPVTREMRNRGKKEVMRKQGTPWYDRYGRSTSKKKEPSKSMFY